MKTLIALAALPLATATLAASPAMAGEYRADTARVAIHDLDLSSEAGAAELQARVRSAASKACRYDASGDMVSASQRNRCAQDTMKKSEGQMAALVVNARNGG